MYASEKACRTCHVVKPLDAFWVQRRKRDGRFSECKLCAKLRNDGWHRANREATRVRNAVNTRVSRRAHTKEMMFRSLKSRALKAGIPFTLTPADLIVPDVCPVLGIPLGSWLGNESGKAKPKDWRDSSPSVDRINPRGGYTPDNIIIVSFRANRIKNNASVSELFTIAEFYGKLEDDRRREGESRRPNTQIHGLSAAVSSMLSGSEEEERSLSTCDHFGPRDTRALPPLQLGSRVHR